jgi:hypothetical protein
LGSAVCQACLQDHRQHGQNLNKVAAMGRCIQATFDCDRTRRPFDSRKLPRPASNQGQSMVGYALTLTAASMIMLVTIRFAIVSAAALGGTPLSNTGALYAAVNATSVDSDISAYLKLIFSPTINENRGGDLSITVWYPGGKYAPAQHHYADFRLVSAGQRSLRPEQQFVPAKSVFGDKFSYLALRHSEYLSCIQSTMMDQCVGAELAVRLG